MGERDREKRLRVGGEEQVNKKRESFIRHLAFTAGTTTSLEGTSDADDVIGNLPRHAVDVPLGASTGSSSGPRLPCPGASCHWDLPDLARVLAFAREVPAVPGSPGTCPPAQAKAQNDASSFWAHVLALVHDLASASGEPLPHCT